MSNYARIINNIAVDLATDPAAQFHPTIAAEFEPVPAEVQRGWQRADNGTWSAPDPVDTAEPVPQRPQVGPTTFKMLWSSPERLKLKELRPADPVIDDFFDIIEDPRLEYVDLALQSTQNGIDYCLQQLVAAGVIIETDLAARREEILSGAMK
jgi:hypothetical protein